MYPAECQVEEHSHTIGIPAYECGHESESEKLSWKISIRADANPETSQKDKSATLMECEANMTALANEAMRSQRITIMLE